MELEFISITASIIEGSAAGPVSCVLTGSDLRPLTPGNAMVKLADVTYLIVPAFNCESCAKNITLVKDWANSNNLCLNYVKSMEIVLVSPRYRHAVIISEPAVPTSPIVEE